VAGDDHDLHGRQFPIARLHHTKTTGLWTLYWRDRNLKFHRYQPLDPSPRVRELLDYLDKHADPIFWDRPKETPRTALLRKPLRSPNDALTG